MENTGNEVKIVSTRENVHCYVYGHSDGFGSTSDIINSTMDMSNYP